MSAPDRYYLLICWQTARLSDAQSKRQNNYTQF